MTILDVGLIAHVIAKHRRVKLVDSKNSMQKCAIYISPKWCVCVSRFRPDPDAPSRRCSEETPRHEGGTKDVAPIYQMRIAADRRPAGQLASGSPAAPRCVGFPLGNSAPRRLLPAHGQPRSTRARNCEFWQRHRAPKRLTKNGRKSRFFNGQRSTEIYYRKQFEASTLFPLTVDR